jgi:hypothetical protein
MMTEPETKTHTAVAYGVEYANGDRDWWDGDDGKLRDEAWERDTSLAMRYPEDDLMPVAKLKRTVVTSLTITREVA